MKKGVLTYRWVYLMLILFVVGCAAGPENEQAGDVQPAELKEEEQPTAISKDAAYTEMSEGVSENIASNNCKKWKNKAKQQLESIQDLTLMLKDSTLDLDFKAAIESELNLLYSSNDSSCYDLNQLDLNFKNFKDLQVENGDTLSLIFKNKKDLLKARFVVEEETKTFGTTSEIVEQLKLISIKKED